MHKPFSKQDSLPGHTSLSPNVHPLLQEKRNSIFGVSSEFLKDAGFVMPISRLIANPSLIKRTGSGRSLSSDQGGSLKSRRAESLPETSFPHGAIPTVLINDDTTDMEDDNFDKEKAPLKKRQQAYHPYNTLREKRLLMIRRIRTCDFSLISAISGILLIVFETELTEAGQVEKDSFIAVAIQCLAVISTFILLYFIIYYHFTELKLEAIDSGTYDWRVGLTWDRILQCSMELCVCAICPLPGGTWFDWMILKDHRRAICSPVRLDAVLSIPMFLRFYLVCRFIVLHSRQFQDAATRSIASLNYIKMNFQFVFRTLIDENPLLVMIIFSVCFCVLMAWILTQCDRYSALPPNRFYLNALWFVVVTYISIGYGDVVPLSYCARALAIFTGIVGKMVSSVLIAIISRQMQLTRSELHVCNFLADSKLCKQRKHAAAKVLQHLWLIHRCKTEAQFDDAKLRQHQRRFLSAIEEFRRIKWEQRKLGENSNSLTEISIAQRDMSETVWSMQRTQCVLATQISVLTNRLHELTLIASKRQWPSIKVPEIDQRLKMKLASIDVEEMRQGDSGKSSIDYSD